MVGLPDDDGGSTIGVGGAVEDVLVWGGVMEVCDVVDAVGVDAADVVVVFFATSPRAGPIVPQPNLAAPSTPAASTVAITEIRIGSR